MNTPLPNENESLDNAPSFNDNEINPVIPVNKRNKTSWVWNYWDEEIQEVNGVSRQVIVCKVTDPSNPTPCRKIYLKSSGSTGNAITHLRNKHDITKEGKIDKVC
jgi:hypothetical protein